MTDRFKPSRAGVINIWDYVDEEWAFADGRIALRGHNGSGKADSRRLDPFSGENRTMKSNLLFRGQESEYGYVWMEFAPASEPGVASEPSEPSAETVTLIIGMRAHRNSDGVRMSFFVTGLRVGVDFGLLSADSRPLTERQLRAVLEPEAWRRTATEYRDLVDNRLFGLGRERYSQLLDLLLALRRPLLAKDLDPAKVSDTLTSGLSPVDDDLVQQAARDFENLAAVQQLFDDLTAANAAVGEFTTHYEAYLRSHVKFALDRVQARSDVAADHAERLAVAAASRRSAVAAERAAESDREASRSEGERLQGRLAGLQNSEEYKAQGRIEDKRREVASRAADVARQRGSLDRDRRRLADQAAAVGKLAQRVTGSRAEADRLAAALADAAQRSGITDDGFGPVDAGDELLATARARVAARRDDIGEIRRLLEAIRDAKAKRAYAEQELTRKVAAHERQQRDADTAAARLAEVRQAAAADLATWSTRWAALAGEDELAGPLAEALALIGNAGAVGLAEVYDDRTAARQAAAIAARTTLDAALGQVRRHLADLRAERDVIAAEQDDAPPASDLRPATRDARAGAPLWQLVRFAPDIPDETAAAIEGALYGAGLLTAWVHPDPALTRTALEAAEADGYLIPTASGSAPGASPGAASRGAKTLADVLIPEDQEHVPSDVIVAVLRSITLTDDIMAAGSDIPAPAASRGVDYVFGYAPAPPPARSVASANQPLISTKAQFSYGVHVGARPKQTPEYIGATNRANRRRARLEEQDDLIAAAADEQGTLAGQADRAAGEQEDFRRARRELPDTRPVAKAAEAASTQAALLSRSREDAETARATLDSAVAEADARTRQLRQAAAERRMPTDSHDVDAIARAAAEFENAASDLHKERATVVRAEEDLAERSEAVERQRLEYAEQETALEEAERAQAALDEEFRSLEEALQTDVQRVLEQIRQAERDLKAAQNAYQGHDTRSRQEHDKVTAADRDLLNERQSLADAIGQLFDQASAFAEFARPDLRSLLGVSTARAWPDPAAWPEAGRASEDLADLLAAEADGAGQPDPTAAVRAALPAAATELLEAFAAATRGGRQVTEGALKNTADRMSVALKDFTDALAACEEDYRVDWEPGGAGLVIVNVIDDEGRKPVAGFATRIDERAKDQGVLLEDRERKVLEDELLAALAGQIHTRVVAARDLTRNMNSDTRSKPMSSGISIGIRWAQSDRITDAQRKASHLLDRDTPGPERLAELRGVLRDMIREYRAGHPRATYREALGSVLDYRSWHAFELILITPGEGEQRLTRAKHSVMSGGEKSAAIHLPLFAAANALYSSAKAHCPRLIALDEAFVGIDERYKPDLFGLAVKFDLDLFMTGHDLWVTTDAVPMIAHYDLYHDKVTRTTSALLLLWDGQQLIDATAGFKDNEALTTELLGFRPTRHTPLGTETTLYTQVLGPDIDDEEDEDPA
ncbi:MAG: SbcC/MukB-like Walker B domain-containing protein [Trebonia sp.]